MQAVAMAEMGRARMVVDQGDDEVELQVGPRQRRVLAQESAGLRIVCGQHAAPFAAPATDVAQQPQAATQRQGDDVGAGDLEELDDNDVVLQVVADLGQQSGQASSQERLEKKVETQVVSVSLKKK